MGRVGGCGGLQSLIRTADASWCGAGRAGWIGLREIRIARRPHRALHAAIGWTSASSLVTHDPATAFVSRRKFARCETSAHARARRRLSAPSAALALALIRQRARHRHLMKAGRRCHTRALRSRGWAATHPQTVRTVHHRVARRRARCSFGGRVGSTFGGLETSIFASRCTPTRGCRRGERGGPINIRCAMRGRRASVRCRTSPASVMPISKWTRRDFGIENAIDRRGPARGTTRVHRVCPADYAPGRREALLRHGAPHFRQGGRCCIPTILTPRRSRRKIRRRLNRRRR